MLGGGGRDVDILAVQDVMTMVDAPAFDLKTTLQEFDNARFPGEKSTHEREMLSQTKMVPFTLTDGRMTRTPKPNARIPMKLACACLPSLIVDDHIFRQLPRLRVWKAIQVGGYNAYALCSHCWQVRLALPRPGKAVGLQAVESGSRFDPNKWQGKSYRGRYWHDEYFDALDMLRPVAKKHGLTEAECALRWMTHHSLLKRETEDVIVIGASSVKHIEQNLVDLEKEPLPEEVLEALNKGWQGC
ncbi:hypothetical protein EJ03DRAFT_360604 [Teratosphaeria nubilosa]|uniref:NADP-dependent oxidoreductase domain-containing protein n=1 Tax=Teratosphaeria nubilosa TaxID=161662 RepID=A0A6G1LCF5_9PEZI|nr:hypothetical protein EJ03DRAFT_360604 [Teratosphaeria nubilosa]